MLLLLQNTKEGSLDKRWCLLQKKSDCISCCKKFYEFLQSVKYFHRLLGYVFSNVSELYIKHKADDTKTTQVLIISEREIPSGYIECSTYLYFIYMLLMCGLWFIAIAVEFSLYRKTGTCNDINANVPSFRCFDVDNNFHQIDCKNVNDTTRVICYLYHPNIAGLGVAFSAAKLVSVVGDIAFTIILKGTNQCSSKCFGVLCILGMLLGSAGLGIFLWSTITRRWDHEYFIYAEIPMRLTQLILLCATILGILLLPPWKAYSETEYGTKYRHLGHMYSDVESGKEPQDEQPQDRSTEQQAAEQLADVHVQENPESVQIEIIQARNTTAPQPVSIQNISLPSRTAYPKSPGEEGQMTSMA